MKAQIDLFPVSETKLPFKDWQIREGRRIYKGEW